MNRFIVVFLCSFSSLVLLGGCTGTQSFNSSARAGDTIALAVGWRQDATRQNTTVAITDSASTKTVYLPGDPAIRSVMNLYPDPVSALVAGTDSGNPFNVQANVYGGYAISYAGNSRDWSQTIVYVDLPVAMAPGEASIDIEINGEYQKSRAIPVEITGLGGAPNPLEVFWGSDNWPAPIETLQRIDNYVVTLAGPGTPHSFQAEFTHDPDVNQDEDYGVGKTHVVNTRGDLKAVRWSDDGTTLKVIVTPVADNSLDRRDYKFHVAGGITGLELVESKVYDSNGELIPEMYAVIGPKISSINPPGPYSAGQQITITGTHLCKGCVNAYDPAVWVGADSSTRVQATIDSADPGTIVVTVPDSITAGYIKVTSKGNIDSKSLVIP